VGVTDFLSFSGGMSLFPGIESQAFYFAPILTFSISHSAGFSTGFLTMKVPDGDGITLGYAVTTFGNRMSDATLGTGIPLNSDSERNLLLLIGGGAQISNSVKLITENWIFTGEDSFILFSGGFRFFSDKLMVDLALLTTEEGLSGEGFPFMPYVDFAVFFGE
ncbi:MAG TPA: hypothetical protein VGB38_00400, partial [bacterium]